MASSDDLTTVEMVPPTEKTRRSTCPNTPSRRLPFNHAEGGPERGRWDHRRLDRPLLRGRFEDDEIREDRHYDMPEDLRQHLEVLNWLRERVAELLDAIDHFGGYFPTDGEVGQATFWWSSMKAKRLKTPCPYPRQLTSSRRTR